MTDTKNTRSEETDDDAEVEAFAVDETPLQTTQKANLDRVVAQTEDERQGIYGQVIQ
jgi:hypothetical protein